MYIHEGVFDYLRAARAVSPRSIDLELEEDVGCYGRNLYGYVILSTVGIASKAKSIDRIRNGEEIRTPRFTPFNFVRLLANKLSQKVQTMNGGLTIEETGACLDETDSTKIAGALILGHEIGHSQRNQAIAYLMLIVGSYMTFKEGFIDSLVPGNQLLDLTSFIGGFAMCFGGLVLSEVLADNFAKRHVEELLPYIITDEYQ